MSVEVGIETFYWKGQLRYKCPLKWESGTRCEFDTFNLDDLKKHMVTDHVRPNGLDVKIPVDTKPEQDFNKVPDAAYESVKFADDSITKE